MDIISVYLREQRRYTKGELQDILKLDEQKVESLIRRLKSCYVLKSVKNDAAQREMSDFADEDVVIDDETDEQNQYLYVFGFVGIIVIGNRILKIYPKYLKSLTAPMIELKQVLKVLEKYNYSKKQNVDLFNGGGATNSFSLLSLILYFMRDYYEYGLYSNEQQVLQINGTGDIDWQRTVDETLPIIVGNRPVYTELYTRKTTYDDNNFFRRLHKIILTESSKYLEKAQLIDLFDMPSLYLTDESLSDLGEKDYILDRIFQELNIQFNTRKQILLQTMYAYIAKDKKVTKTGFGLTLFGTTSFNKVWEEVCSRVFNNQLQTYAGALPLPKKIDTAYYRSDIKLIDFIERPEWKDAKTGYSEKAKNTLIPDLITFQKIGDEVLMIILDAKYYNLQMVKGKPLRGQPGIESITKQYLYELAYHDFAQRYGISRFCNCFIFPTEQQNIINKGYVQFGMLRYLPLKQPLQNIKIRMVPAKLLYQYYLDNRHLDISVLDLG